MVILAHSSKVWSRLATAIPPKTLPKITMCVCVLVLAAEAAGAALAKTAAPAEPSNHWRRFNVGESAGCGGAGMVGVVSPLSEKASC